MGAPTSAEPGIFLCQQNETTFWQLPNGRFASHLTRTRQYVSYQNVSKGMFENICFKGHLPEKLKIKGGQTCTLLRPAYVQPTLQRDIVQRWERTLIYWVRFCSGSMSTRVRFGSGSCQFFEWRVLVLFGFYDNNGSVGFGFF